MTVLTVAAIEAVAARFVGRPKAVEVLKDKPGRRRTVRVSGASRSVIVKAYASARAPIVASRIDALARGPDEPAVPRLIHMDDRQRVVVLSDVPGRPFSAAIVAGDANVWERTGVALGRWHSAWSWRAPRALPAHQVGCELELLRDRAANSRPGVGGAVAAFAPRLAEPWPCTTVVHRDLYEEQVVVDGQIGLIDLDDAASGPPELDLGNLLAHLGLFSRRHRLDTTAVVHALLAGYRTTGPVLDARRLDQCHWLSRLRLACIHDEPAMIADGRRLHSSGRGDGAIAPVQVLPARSR